MTDVGDVGLQHLEPETETTMSEVVAAAMATNYAARASAATAHMKPASSRAIAVQITVVRLPRAASFR
jgi:hypothetical protein